MKSRFAVGDCLDVFGAEPDGSFDSIVADLPAGVNFMSRAWDGNHGHRDRWIAFWAARLALVRQKCKAGAYGLFWALPRTVGWTHRAIEDAGWFVQDCITHVSGQGWPKGKSALKPASEHWILARNGSGGALQIDACRVPRGGPIAAHHGTARTYSGGFGEPYKPGDAGKIVRSDGSWPTNFAMSHCPECEERGTRRAMDGKQRRFSDPMARAPLGYGRSGTCATTRKHLAGEDGLVDVPAFDCLAACDCGAPVLAPAGGEPPRCACGAAMWWACPVAEMDRQSGETSVTGIRRNALSDGVSDRMFPIARGTEYANDRGGASRFFPRFTYATKASGGERDAGCDHLYWRRNPRNPFGFDRVTLAEWEALPDTERARGNVHPTVKGSGLMRQLVALVTPPGGRLGDVTLGSGGTAIGALLAGTVGSVLGCDICPEAVEIAEARLAWWRAHTAHQAGLFGEATTIAAEPKKSAEKGRREKAAAPVVVDARQKGFGDGF